MTTPNDIDAARKLTGWIMPANKFFDVDTCRTRLESLGVVVGAWSDRNQEFENCEVSMEAFDKLEDTWGEFIWGLR